MVVGVNPFVFSGLLEREISCELIKYIKIKFTPNHQYHLFVGAQNIKLQNLNFDEYL